VLTFRRGSVWRCIGIEGQDSCQLLAINTESAYDRRKSTFHCVWPSESSVSDIFIAPAITHYPSIFIHPCPGTFPLAPFLYENPPSIPTIVVARLVCSFRSARLVIDWHNLGYTLLALRLSPNHPLVQLHRLYEQYFSKCAYAHFCVTDLMRRHLMNQYGLENVTTLMDRPPDRFSPLNASAQSLFLTTLPETAGIDQSQTKILVTSTSYTADEPLTPLLSALLKYSETSVVLPRVLLLITGRGPMQEGYRQMIAKSSLSGKGPNDRCTVKMVWLEPEDYPRLLACADLGISLHTSSSGMDFPMKIVDLFGSGIPVCAVQFDAFYPLCVLSDVQGRGGCSRRGEWGYIQNF